MKHIRRLRIALALFFFLGITAIFADPTHTLVKQFGWMAKIQFLPACVALSFAAVGIVVLTLFFGRVYCSVICPLGVMQDIAIWFRRLFVKRGFPVGVNSTKQLHVVIRALVAAMFFSGGFLGLHLVWLAPYAIYGRIAAATVTPLGKVVNNQVAVLAEKNGMYLTVMMETYLPPVAFIVFALSMGALIVALAAWKGRYWCNIICPVGAVLGCLAKFSRFRPRINASRCVECKMCERRCKGRCIDVESMKIDASKCVACYDCSTVCPKGAIKWK